MKDRSIISIKNLSKKFNTSVVLDGVSLEIYEGEFFALLGPSGCGKTTLLRILAGFEAPTEGSLFLDALDLGLLPANRRPINMVFQSYALFPHLNVFDNVAYGLKIKRVKKAELKNRVFEILALVHMQKYANFSPQQLSGGQRQRVALARALVMRPRVLLLDEPLAALDAKLRETMQIELVRLQKELGLTFIMVTHDQEEALSMARRIAIMREGKLLQVDTPEVLYEKPADRFVADFVGRANFFSAKLEKWDGSGGVVEIKTLGYFSFSANRVAAFSGVGSRLKNGVSLRVMLRPSKVEIKSRDIFKTSKLSGEQSFLRGEVIARNYYGNQTYLALRHASGLEIAGLVYRNLSFDKALYRGMDAVAIWNPEDMYYFVQ